MILKSLMIKNKMQKFTWLINQIHQQSITKINWRLKILQKYNSNHQKSNKESKNIQESNLKNEVFWTIYRK